MNEEFDDFSGRLLRTGKEIFYRAPCYSEFISEGETPEFVEILRNLFMGREETQDGRASAVRLGRGDVLRFSPKSSQRPVVLRVFRRGGIVSRFMETTFFHFGAVEQYRPFVESRVLERLASEKIPVPRVIGAFVETSFFGFCYRGIIATEEILESVNLLDSVYLQGENMAELEALCREVGRVSKLILKLGFYPPDLHLGNVLIRAGQEVILIDFDKTLEFEQARYGFYREKVMTRWERSCRKHRVGDLPVRAFREGLYS